MPDKGKGVSADGNAAKIFKDVAQEFKPARKRNRRRGGGRDGGEGSQPKPDTTPGPSTEFKPKAPDRLDPTDDRAADRQRLRQALHDKIDDVRNPNNPNQFPKGGEPCVSAVWDRKSGRVYYDHNVKEQPNRADFDPILQERMDKFGRGEWDERGLKPGMITNYGVPGQHSESRATNNALKDARADGRDPSMDDFWVENANAKTKKPMKCCIQCTQMVDGVDGSSKGWNNHDGKLSDDKGWDGNF
ncbi:hypothetical protein AB0A73_12375 [Glycomyces sp. NPDC047369]